MAPTNADLAIIEVDTDLGVAPLSFWEFSESSSVLGVSTAAPTLVGTGVSTYRLRHTFSYEGLSKKQDKNMLAAMFLLPTTISVELLAKRFVKSLILQTSQNL